jgi:hypothetical protein
VLLGHQEIPETLSGADKVNTAPIGGDNAVPLSTVLTFALMMQKAAVVAPSQAVSLTVLLFSVTQGQGKKNGLAKAVRIVYTPLIVYRMGGVWEAVCCLPRCDAVFRTGIWRGSLRCAHHVPFPWNTIFT